MKKTQPGDEERGTFLQLCEEMAEHVRLMRNHAMKPGNVWLARTELERINSLSGDLEQLLEQIKSQDEQPPDGR
jgi:hypothetical protein